MNINQRLGSYDSLYRTRRAIFDHSNGYVAVSILFKMIWREASVLLHSITYCSTVAYRICVKHTGIQFGNRSDRGTRCCRILKLFVANDGLDSDLEIQVHVAFPKCIMIHMHTHHASVDIYVDNPASDVQSQIHSAPEPLERFIRKDAMTRFGCCS